MLVTWLLVSYGFTLVLTRAKLTKGLRQKLRQLFRCVPCLSFWVGFVLTFFGLGPAVGHVWQSNSSSVSFLLTAGMDAFAASAWCWGVHVLLTHLGADELVCEDCEEEPKS